MSTCCRAVFGICCLMLALTGCGGHSRSRTASTTDTTTGLVPPGVVTEGTRPSSAGLSAAAEPLRAPTQSRPVAGRIVPVGQAPEGVVVDAVTRTVAVATRHPDQLVLLNADTAAITGVVPLPGAVRHLALAAAGGPVLVPVETANAVIRVDLPRGAESPGVITGTAPHDAAAAADGTIFVSNELGGTVAVLRGGAVIKVFADTVQPAGVAAVGNVAGVLDARADTLTIYDAANLGIVGSTPAGAGPTHLIADRHGRMIAADTRGNMLRVFTLGPAPTQVAAVAQPGGPYGIAYDVARDRLWVASSGGNEVIGYDMRSAEPHAIQGFSTIQNPYSLGVDPTTGRLYIAGVTGGALQIIDPSS